MRPRLLLVGAGHTHALVLDRWAADPPDADIAVVTCRDRTTYSGMVPGVIAGDYRPEQTQIPVVRLAGRAGAELSIATATRIDPARRIVEIDGSLEVPYDIASIDVGSAVRGLDAPGARQHAIATRPIDDLFARIERRLAARAGDASSVAVVGGGAAGTEIAFVLRARLGSGPQILLACGKAGLLPGYGPRAQRLVMREAAAHRIVVDATADVTGVDAGGIALGDRRANAAIVVWATGPAAPAVVASSPLPHDDDGFVRVRATLEVVGENGLFAAGDCATLDGGFDVPKAGVHAVREAPVLDRNLRALLAGRPLEDYRPQKAFLSLFNLGGRRALATKWGLATSGRLAWHWKDRIDRGFVERLGAAGT